MKMTPLARRFVAFTVVALVVCLAGCKQGPIDYGKFEQRTIEANLTAIDSASAIYQSQLAAGNIDAACEQAQAFLLTQEGVDTARIAPDSTVWAFFTSGLLAGTGEIRRDTTGDGAAVGPSRPSVRVAGGGEVGDFTHYVLPFNAELPGTQKAGNAIQSIFKRKLGWENDEMFKGSEVDLGLALGEIDPGTSVLFWSGHGTTVPVLPGIPIDEAGLVLGKSYGKKKLAEEAVSQLLGYLNPGPDQVRQAAVVKFVGQPEYRIVILPGFIRANADFNTAESLPINQTKTVVYLSCCFSAYAAFTDPTLVKAFLDAGADVVCGYSWAVGDAWSCDKDTTFLNAMADSCLPEEAKAALGSLIDPVQRLGGSAEFRMFGDSMVLLRAVCKVKRDQEPLVSPGVQATRGSSSSGVHALLCREGSEDIAASVMITFPGDQPGTFSCASEENAVIYWMDVERGHTYLAMKDYVGVDGTIDVDRCRSDVITGHFSGTLGWWDLGKDPEKDPPSDIIGVEGGMFRYTGKVTAGFPAALVRKLHTGSHVQ